MALVRPGPAYRAPPRLKSAATWPIAVVEQPGWAPSLACPLGRGKALFVRPIYMIPCRPKLLLHTYGTMQDRGGERSAARWYKPSLLGGPS